MLRCLIDSAVLEFEQELEKASAHTDNYARVLVEVSMNWVELRYSLLRVMISGVIDAPEAAQKVEATIESQTNKMLASGVSKTRATQIRMALDGVMLAFAVGLQTPSSQNFAFTRKCLLKMTEEPYEEKAYCLMKYALEQVEKS